jgi:hypothetical protein
VVITQRELRRSQMGLDLTRHASIMLSVAGPRIVGLADRNGEFSVSSEILGQYFPQRVPADDSANGAIVLLNRCGDQTNPRRTAMAVTSTRLLTPNLVKRLATCVWTVRGLIRRAVAISRSE